MYKLTATVIAGSLVLYAATIPNTLGGKWHLCYWCRWLLVSPAGSGPWVRTSAPSCVTSAYASLRGLKGKRNRSATNIAAWDQCFSSNYGDYKLVMCDNGLRGLGHPDLVSLKEFEKYMAQPINPRMRGEREAVEPSPDAEILRFPELLIVLAKHKVFILKFVGAATILALLISFLLRNTYTAVTKIMPPQTNQSMATTAVLSQMGPLAALAGQTLGLHTSTDIYVGMLRSRTVADALIDRFSLMSVYKEKRREDARRVLDDRTLIVAGKDGIISISVDDNRSYWFSSANTSALSRQRAADLANGYVEELEKLTKKLAVTEAGKRRAFFERETAMAMDDLATAEQGLKQTQEKTGLILLDPQSRAMIESLSYLRAQIAAKEVQVRAMRSFATAENPDLVRAEQELAALRDQQAKLEVGHGKRSIADVPIENVPAAGLEYIRKLREVKYHEALFELLAKQYEIAKIDEARDALIVQQLDPAIFPERKSGPLRSVIIILAAVLALMLAILTAFFREQLEKAKEDSQFYAQFHLFRFYLRIRQKAQS